MPEIPTRPQWNHPSVQSKAADAVFEDVKLWAISMGAFDVETHSEGDLRALLHLCILQSADCYEAAQYCENFFGWPSNGELVRILDSAYRSMPALTTPFVHEWVMEHSVRFKAREGDEVKFRIGDLEVSGTCVGTIAREARGFVELRDGKVVPVLAEELVRVLKAKRPPARPTPTPPTGGTPVAPRGGAVLTKRKAA